MFDIRQVFQWKGNFPVVAGGDVISRGCGRRKTLSLALVAPGLSG
jgi:hypothetical protein